VSRREEITYALDFRARGVGRWENTMLSSDKRRSDSEPAGSAIPGAAGWLGIRTDACDSPAAPSAVL
jgi:hypothetical protein